MTNVEYSDLPEMMWLVEAIYTTRYQSGETKIKRYFYGPYDKGSTADRTRTWAVKTGRRYEGDVSVDTLNPGVLTVEVVKHETTANWIKSDK